VQRDPGVDEGRERREDGRLGRVIHAGDLESVPVGVAVADGMVFVGVAAGGVGTEPASLLAFPAAGCGQATCPASWTAPAGSPITAPPTLAGGVVYLGTEREVQAYDTAGCGVPTCPPVTVIRGRAAELSVGYGKLFVGRGTDIRAYAPRP
jgi:hypothetical protein